MIKLMAHNKLRLAPNSFDFEKDKVQEMIGPAQQEHSSSLMTSRYNFQFHSHPSPRICMVMKDEAEHGWKSQDKKNN